MSYVIFEKIKPFGNWSNIFDTDDQHKAKDELARISDDHVKAGRFVVKNDSEIKVFNEEAHVDYNLPIATYCIMKS